MTSERSPEVTSRLPGRKCSIMLRDGAGAEGHGLQAAAIQLTLC